MIARFSILCALLIALAGCARDEPAAPAAAAEPAASSTAAPALTLAALTEVAPPSGPGSGEPFLAAGPDGTVYLSWLEPAGDERTALKFSVLNGRVWSNPQTIVERNDLFVNWADFPSIEYSRGVLWAHWLQKSGPGTYAYDVRLVRSDDGGASWSGPITPHDDGTQTEHGFVTLEPSRQSELLHITWLDGRKMGGGHGESHGDMQLRWATVDPRMRITNEAVLDERTCECCQTSMVMAGAGPVVFYRDREEREVRDIAVVRSLPGGWTKPAVVHRDGWVIDACPVNGPQAASRGDAIAVAWYSGANSVSRVFVSFSSDGGATFSKPVTVDDGQPMGRVDLLLVDETTALVTWIERANQSAEVRTRIVNSDGTASSSFRVAESTAARSGGFPRTVLQGDTVYFAWTEPSNPARIRVSHGTLRREM